MRSKVTTNQATVSDSMDGILEDIKTLVRLETWRNADGTNEDAVVNALGTIKAHFDQKAANFNDQVAHGNTIRMFDWKDPSSKYWVFGYRAGTGSRKVSLICHLDTVPPGSLDWAPFDPRVESRLYKGVPTQFLIGRGAIDDKGPAVVAFDAFLNALEAALPSPQCLSNVTLEVLFDTSEETDMSTPHYFENDKTVVPELGIVFDAMWTVRAEKGIERPTFTVEARHAERNIAVAARTITSLKTSTGSTNMIPVTAEAIIHCEDPREPLSEFASKVEEWYRTCPFDDPNYHPAEIAVTLDTQTRDVKIVAKVAGAQHGSAPQQNRATGANPLVSLTNFLAVLLERGVLVNNYHGEMCRFIRWAFGTKVFGENHPDLLYRFDTVFGEGNGTTYGLTQLIPTEVNGKEALQLKIDIRYALGHHNSGWDGSEGVLLGNSVFSSALSQLVARYKSEMGDRRPELSVSTNTVFGPDIRSPRNDHLFRINTAYRSVMGDNSPMLAIGGATDAHGWLGLVTAGALFTDSFGPPINYHGIDEGAPVPDLENSRKILLKLLLQELNCSLEGKQTTAAYAVRCGCGL